MTDRRRLVAVSAAVAALIGGITAWHQRSAPEVPREPAPVVSTEGLRGLFASAFDDFRGQRQPFAQWQGKILVVNFWATWCAPCREEMPYFSRISEKNAAHGVQFVGITNDSPEAVRSFADQHGIGYPLLIGQGAIELSQTLGNHRSGLPYTLVLGRNGEPLLSHTGRLPESKLDDLLKAALTR